MFVQVVARSESEPDNARRLDVLPRCVVALRKKGVPGGSRRVTGAFGPGVNRARPGCGPSVARMWVDQSDDDGGCCEVDR